MAILQLVDCSLLVEEFNMFLKEVEKEDIKSEKRTGWVCPRCSTVISPDMDVCPTCTKDLRESSTTKNHILMG
jgi:rubrerythrin